LAFSITKRNSSLVKQIGLNPQAIVNIEGIETIFGVQPILDFTRWDSNIFFDDPNVRWDGLSRVENSLDVISLDGGTTTNITQQIYPDKSSAGSISSVNLQMVDLNNQVARIFALDVIGEILGRKADFSIGFKQGSIEDQIPVFRGVITDFYTQNGFVNLTISHPDSLKRQEIYEQYLSEITDVVDEAQTVIPVISTEGLFTDQDALTSYVKIEDEIMKVISKTDTTITVNRSEFGTIAVEHEDTEISSFYRLTGNPIDLALKLMLSDENNEFFESLDIPRSITNNVLLFEYFNIQQLTGLVVGDFVRIDGNIYTIRSFSVLNDGSTIELNENIADINDFEGTFAYKSQYNVLPDGLGMLPFQVDVQGHIDILRFNPSVFVDYEIDLKESLDEAKKFLEEQIYFPQGLYAIPRAARSSVKLINPPLSNDVLPTLNTSNIINLGTIKQRRSIHKYLYNIYRFNYELDELDDNFKSKYILVNNNSLNRIKGVKKILKIESQGLRNNPPTEIAIFNIAQRYKDRFSFSPTYFEGIQIKYAESFNLEVGDIIPFGGIDTKVVNLNTGKREQEEKLFEVINKSLNIKTGKIEIDLLETAFNINARYAVVSLSSKTGSSSTTTRINIKKSFDTGEFLNESEKWQEFINSKIRIRSEDYTYDVLTTLRGIDPQDLNFLLVDEISTAPLGDYIVEIPEYDDSNDNYKIRFAYFTYVATISSVASNIEFDVDDATNLVVGSFIYVSSPDFVDDSFGQEVEIIDITGNTITLDTPLSFTPQSDYLINNSNFTDGEFPFNII
jgi:hypothetical protein